jgi:hypothetical protein
MPRPTPSTISALTETRTFAEPRTFAEHCAGRVKAVDLQDRMLTLHDGSTYRLPSHFADPQVTVGRLVEVAWDQSDGSPMANTVIPIR